MKPSIFVAGFGCVRVAGFEKAILAVEGWRGTKVSEKVNERE